MTPPSRPLPWLDIALAWYFVIVWGSGFVATKAGIQYAAPFTFLALRFALGIALLLPLILIMRPTWPTRQEFGHVLVVGFLMHAFHLSGSHYAQYLGLSAGITALIMSLQIVITAFIAARWMGEGLTRAQWAGVALGLAGVAFVVWHKLDIHAMTLGSLFAVVCGLVGITAATLYQRHFCPRVNLYSAAFLQFVLALLVLAPLAFLVEGADVRWTWQLLAAISFLVIFASILAVNALHTLMRRGAAARVTSMIYLTPVIAVLLEYLVFDVIPTFLSVVGIAITCAGVALVVLQSRKRESAVAPPND